jgi:TetR/AcrR family transcriptional regulator, transcriptional repressor for nem operon
MASRSKIAPPVQSVKARLIEAAITIVRQKGYAGTSIDDLCKAAGVTKGAFFHHFASKEALAVEAAQQWTTRAGELIFTLPPWTRIADPLERILAHIDFRLGMLDGPVEAFTCFVGTLVQETFATNDAIRRACDASITAYAERLAEDIARAIDAYDVADLSAIDLAYHIQAVLQGAFILAKAKGDAGIARAAVRHLKHYVQMLFIDQRKGAIR